MTLINLDCLSVGELRCVAKNRALHVSQRVYAAGKASAATHRLGGATAAAEFVERALDLFYERHIPAALRW